MIVYNAELPHELFIRYLIDQGKTNKELTEILVQNDLARPTDTFIDNLRAKTDSIQFNLTPEHLAGILQILNHSEREFVDVLCILYKRNLDKIVKELITYDIDIPTDHITMYKDLLWHYSAIESRTKWKRYLQYLPDEKGADRIGITGYKNLVRLARIGDDDLLFFKLRKRRKNKNRKEMLENALENAQMRLHETAYMDNTLDTSKIAANWGTLVVNITKQIQDLDSQYDDIHEALKEGLAKLKTRQTEYKTLPEVLAENKQISGNVIALPTVNKNG